MSLVIPAGQLSRTIITVRCDTPHSAPQIECALDDACPSSSTATHLPIHTNAQNAILLDLQSSCADSSNFTSPPARIPSTSDLNVERGVDHRGHFVRLSFQPSAATASIPISRPAKTDVDLAPRFAQDATIHEFAPPQATLNTSPFSIPSQSHSPSVVGNVTSHYSSLMNPAYAPAPPACVEENAPFTCSSDTDLMMSALDSFMGMFDMPHHTDYPPFNLGRTESLPSSTQYVGQLPEPITPYESSSSASSCTNSPATPYDFFLPASTPTSDGRCAPGVMSGFTQSASTSLQASPVLGNAQPAQSSRVGPSGRSADSRLLPCPQPGCKRQFKSTSTLGGHMKTHAGKGTRFSCSFPPCTEKFSRRHDQLRHEVYKHGKRCEWVCPKCNSFFSYERSLEKHTCTMDKSRRGSIPTPSSK